MTWALSTNLTVCKAYSNSTIIGWAGALSSICGGVASYPLVVTRTTLMAQGMPGRPIKYSGALDCFLGIFREEGIRGLYRGQVPSLLKTIPSVSIGYAVYDFSKQMLGMKGI